MFQLTVCRFCHISVFTTRYYGGCKVLVCKDCNIASRITKVARNAYNACYKHYNGKCANCGHKGQQVHHKTFVCFGGKSILSNLVLLCKHCHHVYHESWLKAQDSKGDAMIVEGFELKFKDTDARIRASVTTSK